MRAGRAHTKAQLATQAAFPTQSGFDGTQRPNRGRHLASPSCTDRDANFLCRRCYRLAHASQSEGQWDRTLRRANKIKQRLGGDPGMAAPFPPKPKGMWRRTYERLRDRAFEAEMRADEAFVLRAERLLARIDNLKRNKRFWR